MSQDVNLINDQDELIAIAQGLNLEANRRYSVEKLRSMIIAERKANSTDKSQADIDSEKKVSLLIHKTEGDSGSTHVPVSVNGKTWLIRRGENVSVPRFIVDVLKNAVKDIYVQDEVTKGIVKREVPAYPFSYSEA